MERVLDVAGLPEVPVILWGPARFLDQEHMERVLDVAGLPEVPVIL